MNERDGVSNHQPRACLFNILFWRSSKKTSNLRVTGLCEGNLPVTGEIPAKGTVTRKMFPFDDVIIVVYFAIANVMEFCAYQLCHVKKYSWAQDLKLVTLWRKSSEHPVQIFVMIKYSGLKLKQTYFHSITIMSSQTAGQMGTGIWFVVVCHSRDWWGHFGLDLPVQLRYQSSYQVADSAISLDVSRSS